MDNRRHPHKAKTIAELRAMSDQNLIGSHDSLVEDGNYELSPQYYRDELARRAMLRQGFVAEQLAKRIERLTWVLAGLAVINAAAVFVSAS